MRTISFGANIEDEYSECLAKHDRGIVGKTAIKSIKVGDIVFARYCGTGKVVKESENCWYILFEVGIRLFEKTTAHKYLYEA